MDVAGQNAIGILQNGAGLVGKDNLHLRALGTDEVAVVLHVIDTGEFVDVLAKQLAITLQCQHVGVGIDAGLVNLIKGNEMIAHLVGGIAEHQYNLLGAAGDALEADGEAVAGQDGEHHAHGVATQLGLNVGSDGVDGSVVALGAGHDGLGQGNDVTVTQRKSFACGGGQHAVRHDSSQIVALSNNGATDAAGYGTYQTGRVCHIHRPFTYEGWELLLSDFTTSSGLCQ